MRRISELDALRGLAALIVVMSHAGNICPAVAFGPIARWGWAAADLFFVISGFLITSILLRERPRPPFLGKYIVRRMLRIWPIYYLTIFGFVAVNLVLPRPMPMSGLPYYLAYLQNVPRYWGGAEPAFCNGFAHTWTLAAEEQYYLLWPWVLLLAGPRRLKLVALSLAALAVAARGWWGYDMQLLLTRFDGLALGSLLAVLVAEAGSDARRRVRLVRGLSLLGVVALATFGILSSRISAGSGAYGSAAAWRSVALLATNLCYTSLVGLCVLHAGSPRLALLRCRPLVGLGAISYGLYLYHNLIFSFADKFSGPAGPSVTRIGLALLPSLVAAILSWHCVERPILNLRERFLRPAPRREVPAPESSTPALVPAV